MATSTYTPIANSTVTGSNASSVVFSSVPQTYTDLIIVCNWKASSSGNTTLSLRFNSDTGSNYGSLMAYSNNSSAVSARATTTLAYMNFNAPSYVYYAPFVTNIMNYANTTTNKTIIGRSGAPVGGTSFYVNTWLSTAAISTVTLVVDDGGASIGIGSTFALYGIKAA